jgi:hypothetical protein
VRGRFVELVGRQLELFEAEWASLLEDCQAALDEYNAAPRDEAEERYGDYLDLVDTARDALLEYRDGFARTLRVQPCGQKTSPEPRARARLAGRPSVSRLAEIGYVAGAVRPSPRK